MIRQTSRQRSIDILCDLFSVFGLANRRGQFGGIGRIAGLGVQQSRGYPNFWGDRRIRIGRFALESAGHAANCRFRLRVADRFLDRFVGQTGPLPKLRQLFASRRERLFAADRTLQHPQGRFADAAQFVASVAGQERRRQPLLDEREC